MYIFPYLFEYSQFKKTLKNPDPDILQIFSNIQIQSYSLVWEKEKEI